MEKLEKRVLFASGEVDLDAINASNVSGGDLDLSGKILEDSAALELDSYGLGIGGGAAAIMSALLIGQSSPDKFLGDTGVSQETLFLTLGGLLAFNMVKEPVKVAFQDVVDQVSSLWGDDVSQGEVEDFVFDEAALESLFDNSDIDFEINENDLNEIIDIISAIDSADADLESADDEGHWSDFIKQKSGAANGLYFLIAKKAAQIIVPKALAYAGLSVGFTVGMPAGVAGVGLWFAADLVMSKAFSYALGNYTQAITNALIDQLSPYGDDAKDAALEALNDFQEWWSQPSSLDLGAIGDAMGSLMSSSAETMFSSALYVGDQVSQGVTFSAEKLMELNESFMDWWNQPSTFVEDTLASISAGMEEAQVILSAGVNFAAQKGMSLAEIIADNAYSFSSSTLETVCSLAGEYGVPVAKTILILSLDAAIKGIEIAEIVGSGLSEGYDALEALASTLAQSGTTAVNNMYDVLSAGLDFAAQNGISLAEIIADSAYSFSLSSLETIAFLAGEYGVPAAKTVLILSLQATIKGIEITEIVGGGLADGYQVLEALALSSAQYGASALEVAGEIALSMAEKAASAGVALSESIVDGITFAGKTGFDALCFLSSEYGAPFAYYAADTLTFVALTAVEYGLPVAQFLAENIAFAGKVGIDALVHVANEYGLPFAKSSFEVLSFLTTKALDLGQDLSLFALNTFVEYGVSYGIPALENVCSVIAVSLDFGMSAAALMGDAMSYAGKVGLDALGYLVLEYGVPATIATIHGIAYTAATASDIGNAVHKVVSEKAAEFSDWWNQPSTFVEDTLAQATEVLQSAYEGVYGIGEYLVEDIVNDIETIKYYGAPVVDAGIDALYAGGTFIAEDVASDIETIKYYGAPVMNYVSNSVLQGVNDFSDWWNQPSTFVEDTLVQAAEVAQAAYSGASAAALYVAEDIAHDIETIKYYGTPLVEAGSEVLYAGGKFIVEDVSRDIETIKYYGTPAVNYASEALVQGLNDFSDWWNQPSTFVEDTLAQAAEVAQAAYNGASSAVAYVAKDIANDIEVAKSYAPTALAAMGDAAEIAYETHVIEVGTKATFKAGVKTILSDNGTWWGILGGKVVDFVGCKIIDKIANPSKR